MARSSVQKSTIVRAKNDLTRAATRRGFALAERFAPRIGSRAAERLWLALPKKAWIPKDDAADLGESFELALDARSLRPRHVVRGEVWSPDARGDVNRDDAGNVACEEPATVYLMHGWGGYRGQLDAFVRPLVEAGFRVVAFDAPSHGESDAGGAGPKHGLLPEFANALTAAVGRFGPAHAVIAHSLGSSATALAVLDGFPVERLVFMAPMTDPGAFSHVFAQLLGFGERIRTGFLRRLERRVGRPMADFDIPARVRAAVAVGDRKRERPPGVVSPLPRLLIVHDVGDREAAHAASGEMVEIWPGALLTSTQGLGHYRILRDAAIVGEVAKFVAATSAYDQQQPKRPADAEQPKQTSHADQPEHSDQPDHPATTTTRRNQPCAS